MALVEQNDHRSIARTALILSTTHPRRMSAESGASLVGWVAVLPSRKMLADFQAYQMEQGRLEEEDKRLQEEANRRIENISFEPTIIPARHNLSFLMKASGEEQAVLHLAEAIRALSSAIFVSSDLMKVKAVLRGWSDRIIVLLPVDVSFCVATTEMPGPGTSEDELRRYVCLKVKETCHVLTTMPELVAAMRNWLEGFSKTIARDIRSHRDLQVPQANSDDQGAIVY